MNFSILRHLPGFGKRPLHRLVSSPGPGALTAEAAVQHLLAELPELLMAAVVGVGSGQLLASYTSQADLWPGTAGPSWVALVQQVQASLEPLGSAPPAQLEEVLTTLPSQLHLLRLAPGGQHLLYLAVGAHDTNLALARELMRQAISLLATTSY